MQAGTPPLPRQDRIDASRPRPNQPDPCATRGNVDQFVGVGVQVWLADRARIELQSEGSHPAQDGEGAFVRSVDQPTDDREIGCADEAEHTLPSRRKSTALRSSFVSPTLTVSVMMFLLSQVSATEEEPHYDRLRQ